MREVTGIGGVASGSGVRAQVARPAPVHGGPAGRVGEVRRRASGPRPVRPGVPLTLVRPAQPARPPCGGEPVGAPVGAPVGGWMRAGATEPRVLVRPGASRSVPAVERLRRVLAGVAVVLVTAAVVVGLGLLASAVSAGRGAAPGAPATVEVTVEHAGTVWEIARSVAPEAGGPATADLVQRIVTLNGLESVSLVPGEVLRVPVG